ncbi:unnamed protein product [Mycena citricolor]|uniref:Ubiquitin-conjugating enzyme E2 6 n=1 Tax=Mycena citricolor TaxID=2018698 RepID=A0AAD2HSE7_9AGAR|nr:unnamed protein product [Mycena citricolor]CAK5280965.1 unnamed protein product [Mycena citricolor]
MSEFELLRRLSDMSAYCDVPSRPACASGTRESTLHDLTEWACSSTASSGRALQLAGPAGVGKSTILRSLTSRLRAAGRLAASFAFSASHKCDSFVFTLAYQLACNVPSLREHVLAAVRKDPKIASRSAWVQLRELIVQPCSQADVCGGPFTFIIDGVDEDDLFQDLFRLFSSALRQLPAFKVVTTAEDCGGTVHRVEPSVQDVRVLFEAAHVDADLAEFSGGCPLYASTLIIYLEDHKLETGLKPGLDALYTFVLSQVPWRDALLVLLAILVTPSFAGLTVEHVDQLVPGGARRLMRYLRCVLDVSTMAMAVRHPSTFIAFLLDPSRSSQFCVAESTCLVRAMLQVCGETRVNHIAWKHLTTMVDYITSSDPDPGLLPIVQQFNPDYLFGTLSAFEASGVRMIQWLQKFDPLPTELIQLWNDYAYLNHFHSIVNDFDFDQAPNRTNASFASLDWDPELIRLLRVSVMLPALTPLFPFRVLLGMSWDELRKAACSLRSVDDASLASLWRLAWQDPSSWDGVFRDVALQSIRTMKAAHADVLPRQVIGFWMEWGRFVRSSPPCPLLANELASFVPEDDCFSIATEVYDVIRWLEVFPKGLHMQRERHRWMSYIPGSTHNLDDLRDAFETRWESWKDIERLLVTDIFVTPVTIRDFPYQRSASISNPSASKNTSMASKAAYKRLTKEYVTMQKEPPPFVWAAPDEKNILTWNFIIRGPSDSPYAGGEYHGVLMFPSEYPFKPPGIKMMTPSGRFHPDKKICFSMSDFHPGTWNPAWSVATILTGLLSFMLSDEMTTGSVNTSDAHKRVFAARSHEWNLGQSRFKDAFPEYCTPQIRDVPNMGEKERGASAPAPPQPEPVSAAPATSENKAVIPVDDAVNWTTSLGQVLWEKWRWGLFIILAVVVSRISSPA